MAENTEATALKNRRAATTKAAAEKNADPTGNVTGSTQPVMVGKDEPARNFFMLGDPDEPRAVIEASGGMYGQIVGDDYVIAPEDATETFAPPGCTTTVTRQRWARGQHVPREVFVRHYGKEQAAKLLEPVLVVEIEEAPEAAKIPAPVA